MDAFSKLAPLFTAGSFMFIGRRHFVDVSKCTAEDRVSGNIASPDQLRMYKGLVSHPVHALSCSVMHSVCDKKVRVHKLSSNCSNHCRSPHV